MRAHIPIDRRTRKEINRLTAEVLQDHKEGFMRRVMKVFYYCLNREYGFGKSRIKRLDELAWRTMQEAQDDEAFFEHIDRVVIDELGIELKREIVSRSGLPIDD